MWVLSLCKPTNLGGTGLQRRLLSELSVCAQQPTILYIEHINLVRLCELSDCSDEPNPYLLYVHFTKCPLWKYGSLYKAGSAVYCSEFCVPTTGLFEVYWRAQYLPLLSIASNLRTIFVFVYLHVYNICLCYHLYRILRTIFASVYLHTIFASVITCIATCVHIVGSVYTQCIVYHEFTCIIHYLYNIYLYMFFTMHVTSVNNKCTLFVPVITCRGPHACTSW